MAKNSSIGSSLDLILDEKGLLDKVEAGAIKSLIASKLTTAMESQAMSKAELARRMKTSRAAVNRLLNPDDTGVTLQTLVRASVALGLQTKLTFIRR